MDAISAGAPFGLACQAAGIHCGTFVTGVDVTGLLRFELTKRRQEGLLSDSRKLKPKARRGIGVRLLGWSNAWMVCSTIPAEPSDRFRTHRR
jgi:hypothetical protein